VAQAKYPSSLEPGVYEFEGWYTTEECYAGSEVNWETITMPDSNLILYAKWKPVIHEVKIYKTEGGEQLANSPMNITHRLTASADAE